MSTQAVGTYKINSFWESGRLIFYEKASGHTTTGNVFILGHDYVQVGDTANAVDLKWYGTTTGTFTLDAAAHTLAMTGVATSTDGAVTITNATASTTTATGALIISGGVGIVKDVFIGGDVNFTTSVESAAVADQVSLGCYEISAGHRALAISSEEVVAAEVDETKFSDKLPVRINGTTYYIMLTVS